MARANHCWLTQCGAGCRWCTGISVSSVILTNINWTIRSGESWALLGPIGTGKTTLLSLILGDNPQVYTKDVVVFGRQRGGGESIWNIKKHIPPSIKRVLRLR